MVELPSAEAARRAASLPDELVSFGLVFEAVQRFLDWAADFVAEFTRLVLDVLIDGHVDQQHSRCVEL